QQTAAFSFWTVNSNSTTVTQDFDIKMSESLVLRAGARYEQKDLQKEYDVHYGPRLPPSSIDGSLYPYPPQPGDSTGAPNRLTTESIGGYLQSWWRLSKRDRFNFGIRHDHDSRHGGATTVRMGYVGTEGPWGLKTLFGQAFQEPNNRLLYGGWDGSGSDPRLRPERSTTMEVNGSYTRASYESMLSVYHIVNRSTFVNTIHSAKNLGDRHVTGLDASAQWLLSSTRSRELRAWASYSHIFQANEKKLDENGVAIGTGPVGDLAMNKIHIGVTSSGARWTGTLRGRWFDHRDTVTTNPVPRVPSYASFDAMLRVDDVLAKGISVALSATNLTDKSYFDPGVRDANAGVTPGYFDARGRWIGSAGYFNSLLPQPGRQFVLSLEIRN